MLNSRIKKTFITGAIFGVIASFLAIFIGLQVSPVLANILLFPITLISKITSQPLGNWSVFLQIFGLMFSAIVWGLIFVGISKVLKKAKTYGKL